MWKWLAALILLVALTGAGTWAYFRYMARQEDERTYRVVRDNLGRSAHGLGKVECVRAPVALSFLVPGRLKDVKFRDGDLVAAEQPVAELEVPGLEYQAAVAEAAVQEAKAQEALVRQGARPQAIQQLEEQVARAEKAVALERLKLKNLQEPLPPPPGLPWQIEVANLEVERARQVWDEALAAQTRLHTTPTTDQLAVGEARVKLAEIDWEDAKEKARLILDNYKSHMRDDQISELTMNVERMSRKLQLTRNEYDQLKRGPAPGEKEAAAARVLAAKASYEMAVSARKRLENPPLPAPPTERDIEAAKLAVESALAQEREARAAVELLRAGPREAELQVAAAVVKKAEKTLEEIQARRAQTSLRAPFAGLVLEQPAQTGCSLAPYAPVLTLADLSALRVRGELDVSWAAEAKAAQEVLLTASLVPQARLTGKIERVLNQIGAKTLFSQDPRETKGGEVVEVLIALDRPADDLAKTLQAALRPGLRMDVEVHFETRRNILTVPRSFIRLEEGRYVVYKAESLSGEQPIGVRRVTVELGYSDEASCEVVSGVVEGDLLVKPPRERR